jgi:hypothetical protein
MKNIVFVLKPHERTSISNVINGIKSYPVNCRIDFVANELVIEIEEEGKIDEVIDFISQNYNIERIDIYVKTKGTNECVVSFGGEESVCVNGVQYNSANLKVSLDKLFKTLNLAHASTGRISNADICYYLDSCKHEMIMHFNPISKVKDIKVGDVICVNYGMHSGGEISGITFAIVCNIKENLFLLVPISNEKDITPVQNAAGITKTMAPRDELTLDIYEAERPVSDVHDFYRNFVAAIDKAEEPIVKISEVRRVMEVMEAAFASSEKKSGVEVNI